MPIRTKKAQTEARMQLVDVVREWGEQRGVNVKELLFRMRTATLQERRPPKGVSHHQVEPPPDCDACDLMLPGSPATSHTWGKEQ